jgi:hypothetical protein
MSQSDYIALAALAVAALAALYAKWAANEAKRANEISLHVHKIEIYEEVLSFSDCFRGLFTVPSEVRLESFRKKAVQRAEIYLSKEVHLQLQEIYNHCRENEIWLNIAESEGRRTENTPDELEVRSAYKSVLNLIYPVIQSIKAEAMVDHA